MNMEENENKAMALMALAANFGREFPKALLKIWLDLLEPYTARQVASGVKRLIAEYEYKTIPPFAALRKHIVQEAGCIDPETALDMQANAEWEKLLDDLSSRGIYNGVPEDMHETTAYALRCMGGWNAACQWQTDKLEWRRKEFLELWRMSHGHEDTMRLGASAIGQLSAAPIHASEAIGAVVATIGALTSGTEDMP